jgi:superfamily I DNA and/or RNA helicase
VAGALAAAEASRAPTFGLGEIRITTVDNFQGEENDIILLSLVRSSTPGFIKEANRACVALSRARHGLIVFGRAALLRGASAEWAAIFD